jgi:hypothetical protein
MQSKTTWRLYIQRYTHTHTHTHDTHTRKTQIAIPSVGKDVLQLGPSHTLQCWEFYDLEVLLLAVYLKINVYIHTLKETAQPTTAKNRQHQQSQQETNRCIWVTHRCNVYQ